ncbi:MAG: VWA domain-containing protein [Acidimicrobiia bacterium]|nr:VWA domain-containing protein [Acidimicrobiia bacterium]
MSFLAPAALGLLALAIPLVVLYMLRSRRQRLEVPSVLMWSGEEQFVSAALPWQRLKITGALLLQLLALIGFAVLLGRPFFREQTLLGPHTVVIVDSSGSMATSGRLDDALSQARGLAGDASEAQLISVVEAGGEPRVLAAFAREPAAVLAALDSIEAGGTTDNLAGALRLARGLATPDRPTSLLILSDGGTAGTIEEPVVSARHVLFDASGDNVAITGFGTGVPGEGAATRLFLEVSNFSVGPRDVEVSLLVDGLEVGSVGFSLDAGERSQEIVTVDAGPGQAVSAVLNDFADANSLDNSASVVLSAGTDLTVTVTGEGSPFLNALVESVPGIRPAAGAPPDVLIVDGGDAAIVDRPAWIIAPAKPPSDLPLLGRLDSPIVTYQRPGEPILEGLDLSELAIAEADIVDAFGWLSIVRAGDVPLVLMGEIDGHRVVYFTFDVVRSNLPVQVTFPILGARILDWLGGNRVAATSTAPAGTPLGLTPPAGGSSIITAPSGHSTTLSADAGTFTSTAAPGIYQVEYRDDAGATVGSAVAARQFVATESIAEARQIATTFDDSEATAEGTLLREWAPYILAALLGIILLEWWVAFGRPLPSASRARVGATS